MMKSGKTDWAPDRGPDASPRRSLIWLRLLRRRFLIGVSILGVFGGPSMVSAQPLETIEEVASLGAEWMQAKINSLRKPAGVARPPRLSMFDIELPMAFRARLATIYVHTPFLVDAIAYNRWQQLGPAVETGHFFENRLSLVRPVWEGIELEVAWSSHSLVSISSNPSFDRQTVGAFLRFAH